MLEFAIVIWYNIIIYKWTIVLLSKSYITFLHVCDEYMTPAVSLSQSHDPLETLMGVIFYLAHWAAVDPLHWNLDMSLHKRTLVASCSHELNPCSSRTEFKFKILFHWELDDSIRLHVLLLLRVISAPWFLSLVFISIGGLSQSLSLSLSSLLSTSPKCHLPSFSIFILFPCLSLIPNL